LSDTAPRPVELIRALAVLSEPPAAAHARLAALAGLEGAPGAAEYTEALVLGVPPYASVYLGADGMIGGEARERIAGFWRATGQTPPAEPDHLGALLGLYAALAERAAAEGRGATDPAAHAEAVLAARARDALLYEHLAPWVPVLLGRVAEQGGFYAGWAELLARVLDREILAAAEADALPVHLRLARPLPDPRTEDSADFLRGLLAPARSGMIVTRRDLADIARTLALGIRLGERRRVLDHLLGQEPAEVLCALAGLARTAAEAHAARSPVLGGIAVWWRERAEACSSLLESLAAEAGAEAIPVGSAERP
jgi:nitrate reductase assembly molybdenum cofactor insertion protein NarJ